EYAGWEQTDFFVKNGQMIWDIWDNTMNGVTLEEMLTQKKYGKIYIMLGINELGVGTADEFGEQFKTVVARVRELQPETIIFVEAIMHVTAGKDEENTYINNAEVNARNERLAQIPDNIMSFYIDVNEVLDDPATGKLNGAYSFDGVHIQAKYIDIWREFLLNHGIL
ncbi:MAG: acylhydrolase, partial [Lachnospiraceae bacterium]